MAVDRLGRVRAQCLKRERQHLTRSAIGNVGNDLFNGLQQLSDYGPIGRI